MSKETPSKEIKPDSAVTSASASQAAGPSADLSEAIGGSIETSPGEEVRIVRVYGDNYRCNWWVRDPVPGPVYLNVGRISRSKFLRATMNNQKLVIEDLSLGSK